MIICSSCKRENQPHYRFCLGCGGELPRSKDDPPAVPELPRGAPQVRCGYCSFKVDAGAARCPNCSAPL